MTRPVPPVIPVPIADDEARPVTLNPKGWPVPRGYANGMTARGRIVVTGGVVGWDVMGNFAEDFASQARQCFSNIAAILAEGGVRPHHLVRLTWYVTDIEEYSANLRPLGLAYREIFGQHYPAMAVVQVVRLVEKAAKIEIEATAILPD
ncbi:RidA family protein [Phreatobacter sp.]|uniref:RidA family protein n=1 Tax=Phreatobacter sp. TaxID=1966341 RepID=UPI003F6F369B